MSPSSIWTRPRLPGEPAFIGGHRGASSQAGENSTEAFETAIAAGADFIEFDWRLTRDAVPIVFHDDTLARLYGDARTIGTIGFPELHAIDPGILTVAQALEIVRGRISILLDTKTTEPDALRHGLQLIAPHLGDDASVAFGTRSLAASEVVREHLPESPVLGLFRNVTDYPDLHEMGGTWARLWEDDASPESIAKLQSTGFKVIVMAGQPTHESVGVITPHDMARLLSDRPDAVMLNDVSLGLAARSALNVSEPNSPGG
ncbi:MAG: glycerophosphodiester phosphodiesterase [Rhizobiales bacterium]|nr:glycerophosphodiester phosphodiesterase [Hyphomicrobiales bacterium]